MHVTGHKGCTDTVTESALEVKLASLKFTLVGRGMTVFECEAA